MFLHQEYIQRNGLDIDWIGHPQRACLILRSNNAFRHRWVIVQFHVNGPDFHPKHYDLTVSVPRKANPKAGINFGFSTKKYKIQWDQLDYTLRSWLKRASKKFRVVKSKHERELTLWEMFVSTHDSMLSKVPFETKKSLAVSIHPSIPLEERYNSYQSVLSVLENRYSKTFLNFSEKFLAPFLETVEFTNL